MRSFPTSATTTRPTECKALVHNVSGDNNTANGVTALFSNTTGRENTADGSVALFNNTTGDNNNCVRGWSRRQSHHGR